MLHALEVLAKYLRRAGLAECRVNAMGCAAFVEQSREEAGASELRRLGLARGEGG